MKRRLDKLVAAVVAFLMLVLPGALSARERRGANLVITLKDGRRVEGELIAVKPDSLLLLSLAGKDESVDIAGVREIKVVKKSQALKGGLYGLLMGAALGTVVYLAETSGVESDDWPDFYEWPLVFAVPAGLLGLGVGALAGSDKTIRFERMSESDRTIALDRLRRHARIRDYR
jgi:hypothetical protein